MGRQEPPARPHRPGAGGFQLGWMAGRGGRAAVYRQRVLPPRQLAQTSRFRHRHLRRHGLPHPRSRFHVARPDRADLGSLGGGRGTQRRQLEPERPGALRFPRHEIHDGNADPELVQRQPSAAGVRAVAARRKEAAATRDRSTSARRACCIRRTSRSRCCCRRRSSRTTRCRVRRATIITCSSSRRVGATAKLRRRFPTPAR